MRKPKVTKTKNGWEINVTGNRDYRSPDVDILVSVNEDDEITMIIPKSQRCYGYKETVETQGFTKIVFN